MVIVRLQGGLGNQMFQYAFALSLRSRGRKVLLDISQYNTCQMHYGYELEQIFGVREQYADDRDIANARQISRFSRILSTFLGAPKGFVKEKDFRFREKYLQVRDGALLQGYWQNERYFRDISKMIRNVYTFPPIKNPIALEVLDQVEKSESVAVHVRGGDYLEKNAAVFHGVLTDTPYYENAAIRIGEMVGNPRFFVFSDDPEWAMKRVRIPHSIKVPKISDESGYLHMQLMSRCKHIIVANSSFSWWAAWLNPNPRKCVVAPRVWFRDRTLRSENIPLKQWWKV